jgi:RNA polymerase sigma factor (sigma-70 family)
MGAMESAESGPGAGDQAEVTALIPMVRRIVFSRVSNHAVAEDLVQETLVKVLGAAHRIEPGMLEPYAIVTARNLVASMWREQDRQRRNEHRVVDLVPVKPPDEDLLRREETDAVSAALGRLSERDRRTLLAHEISG